MYYILPEDELVTSDKGASGVSDIIFWNTDRTGRCKFISDSWSELTGLIKEDALNEGRLSPINSHDLHTYKREYSNAIENRLPFKIEYRLKDKTGRFRRMLDVGAPFYNSENQFEGYSGTSADIESEKLTKAELELIADEHRDFTENATIGVFRLDADQRVIMVNNELLQILDYNENEFKGYKISEFIDDMLVLKDIETKKLFRNNYKNLLWRVRCKTGLSKYLNLCTSVFKVNGRPAYVNCYVTDVTAYKFSEESLRERNKTLQILNSIGNTISAKLDLKILVKAVTDAATGISGAEFGVFYYSNADDILQTNNYEAISGSPAGGFANYPLPASVRFSIFKSGRIIRINDVSKEAVSQKVFYNGIPEGFPIKSYMAIPITSRDGEVLGGIFLGHSEPNIFTDITETFVGGIAAQASIAIDNAKLFEAKREGEERFRILAESIPQMIFTAQPNGSIDYCNKRWQEYTGLTPEETLGMGWVQSIYKKDLIKSVRLWKESIEENSVYEMEYRLRRASDNTYRWHLVRAIPINDEYGNIIKWFGTCTDIDDQKKQHQKKDDFISIASHELKTPLTSIKAYVQLLERMMIDSDNEIVKTYLKKTNTYINRLNNLIADLLDVSRIQSGKMQFNMSDFNINELVNETIESIQHTSTTHKIIKRGEACLIRGDKSRLEQVLINFLTNAIKYSPGCADVFVDIEQDNDFLKVSVSDFGIGIPQDKLNKVFERFYRVESAAHKFTGLGIGLYISSEIIKRHSGRVWVESEEGKGATFSFVIPVGRDKV